MADYSSAYERDCCPSGVFDRHKVYCPRNPYAEIEKLGYEKTGNYWECQVCFCLVSNTEAHRAECEREKENG